MLALWARVCACVGVHVCRCVCMCLQPVCIHVRACAQVLVQVSCGWPRALPHAQMRVPCKGLSTVNNHKTLQTFCCFFECISLDVTPPQSLIAEKSDTGMLSSMIPSVF
jgi:hypothetical protein